MPRGFRLFLPLATLGSLLAISLCACTYEHEVWSQWDQFRSLPNQATSASHNAILDRPPGNLTGLDKPSWAIRLKTFDQGDEIKQRHDATAWTKKIQASTQMSNLWVAPWENRTAVYRGRFLDIKANDAQDALRQTRMIRHHGLRRFHDADFERVDHLLRSTTVKASAAGDDADLRRYLGQDLWSLQIAVFDEHQKDRQRATEAMVKELRAAGEKAFYYHTEGGGKGASGGGGRSMVTVGIFTYDEAWVRPTASREGTAKQDVYSSAVRDLQEKYPYNLLNGQRIAEHDAEGKSLGEQPSFLVKLK